MSLAIEGYTSGGPVGFGARGSAVTVVGSDGAPAVAVAIDDDDRAASLRRLAHLRNAGLPVIVEIAPARSGGYALVMEPVSGPNLATLIEARGSLSAAEAAELWRVLADALAALHSHGIVHGDVSPPNVIIGKDGPVLLDIAGHAGREVGRLGYVPPEVEAGGRPGTESDVCSLARIISWASGEDPEVVRALGRPWPRILTRGRAPGHSPPGISPFPPRFRSAFPRRRASQGLSCAPNQRRHFWLTSIRADRGFRPPSSPPPWLPQPSS